MFSIERLPLQNERRAFNYEPNRPCAGPPEIMSKSDWNAARRSRASNRASSRQVAEGVSGQRTRGPAVGERRGHDRGSSRVEQRICARRADPWVMREAYCRAVLAHRWIISTGRRATDRRRRGPRDGDRVEQIAARKAPEPGARRKPPSAARAAAAKPPPPPCQSPSLAASAARGRPGAAEGAEAPDPRRVRKEALAQARAWDD